MSNTRRRYKGHTHDGSSIWIYEQTHENIKIILEWLRSESKKVQEKRPDIKTPRFNLNQVSKGTGIDRKQVKEAVWTMISLKRPKHYFKKIKLTASFSKFDGVRKKPLQEISLR